MPLIWSMVHLSCITYSYCFKSPCNRMSFMPVFGLSSSVVRSDPTTMSSIVRTMCSHICQITIGIRCPVLLEVLFPPSVRLNSAGSCPGRILCCVELAKSPLVLDGWGKRGKGEAHWARANMLNTPTKQSMDAKGRLLVSSDCLHVMIGFRTAWQTHASAVTELCGGMVIPCHISK